MNKYIQRNALANEIITGKRFTTFYNVTPPSRPYVLRNWNNEKAGNTFMRGIRSNNKYAISTNYSRKFNELLKH